VTDATLASLAARPLPGAETSWPRRRVALAELASAGWPTRRQERWRYTDVGPLVQAGFDVAPTPPRSAELHGAAALLEPQRDPAGARLVFVDGHYCPELGTRLPAGIDSLELDAESHEFDRWASRVTTANHPFAALNTAFSQHGLLIRARSGTVVDAPLEIVFVGSGRPNLVAQPRLALEIGADARLTIVQRVVDMGAAPGWLNVVTQIRQAAASSLELYRLQQHHHDRAHTSLLTAELQASAELRVGYVDLGGRLVRNDVDVALVAPGARAELFGLFVPGEDQHLDTHTTIVHAAPETKSDEAFRGVIGERGRGVFNGKVVVNPKAQRIEAHQSNDNLLLGARAEIDTKPELEIYANDVKCSHGSTVGELDGEQLFYLRARGIADVDARQILTTAFAAEVLERVRNEPWRTHLLEVVRARLHSFSEHEQ
jgi:Fe-S cluster assembly protein SufD